MLILILCVRHTHTPMQNAGEMLDKLRLKYNRTRQARITTELIEIISGQSSVCVLVWRSLCACLRVGGWCRTLSDQSPLFVHRCRRSRRIKSARQAKQRAPCPRFHRLMAVFTRLVARKQTEPTSGRFTDVSWLSERLSAVMVGSSLSNGRIIFLRCTWLSHHTGTVQPGSRRKCKCYAQNRRETRT